MTFSGKSKDYLETIRKLSICVCFKLLTYYHSITRQTNWINLNKPNTLKRGNHAEIMKVWFSMNCQTKKYFFQEFKYFFSIGVSHTVALLSLTLKVWKTFPKRLLMRKHDFCIKKYFFPKKRKNLSLSVLMFPLDLMLFVLLEQVLPEIEKSWNQWEHWYWYQVG